MNTRVQRPDRRDPRQHAVQVLRRRAARPHAWNETAVFAQHFGILLRVEDDRRVEKCEQHDQHARTRIMCAGCPCCR